MIFKHKSLNMQFSVRRLFLINHYSLFVRSLLGAQEASVLRAVEYRVRPRTFKNCLCRRNLYRGMSLLFLGIRLLYLMIRVAVRKAINRKKHILLLIAVKKPCSGVIFSKIPIPRGRLRKLSLVFMLISFIRADQLWVH